LDCLLVPLPDVDLGTAASLAKRALDAGPADASSCENQLAFGLANYRQAHYAEATNWLAKSIAGSAQNMVCAAQAQAAHPDGGRNGWPRTSSLRIFNVAGGRRHQRRAGLRLDG